MIKAMVFHNDDKDSWSAGASLAKLYKRDLTQPAAFLYLLVTPDHQIQQVLEGIKSLLDSDIPLFGAKADGVVLRDGLHSENCAALLCVESSSLQFFVGGQELEEKNLHSQVESFALTMAREIGRSQVPRDRALLLLFNDNRNDNETVSQKIFEILNPLCQILGGVVHGYDFGGPLLNDSTMERGILGCLILFQEPLNVGVAHGWKPIGPYVVATQTEGNRIISINGRNAFLVYREMWQDSFPSIEGKSHDELKDLFYGFAQYHPLGISQMKGEFLIRDPYEVTEQGHILCGGDIPENSVLHFMEGNADSLLSAAHQAVNGAKRGSRETLCLLFDCFTRIFLPGFDINEEIELLSDKLDRGVPVFGMMSRGEFASIKKGANLFHNKSMALTIL